MKRTAAGETVDPSDYYMRTHARLETGHPDYQWVNETLFLGVGGRLRSSVRLSLYAIDLYINNSLIFPLAKVDHDWSVNPQED